MTTPTTLITNDEIISLERCRSENDWNQACDRIKTSRGGQYPEDWWARVMLSGLMAHVVRSFPPRLTSSLPIK